MCGRTSRTNDDDGPDCRNQAFMCLLVGAGIVEDTHATTSRAPHGSGSAGKGVARSDAGGPGRGVRPHAADQ